MVYDKGSADDPVIRSFAAVGDMRNVPGQTSWGVCQPIDIELGLAKAEMPVQASNFSANFDLPRNLTVGAGASIRGSINNCGVFFPTYCSK